VLTPVKNAAHHAAGFVDRVLSLTYPALRVAILVSDSDDGTADAFRSEFSRLSDGGIKAEVFEQDFGYAITDGTPRWDPSIQLERRLVLARSRNHLLSRGLQNAAWALWIDVDVVEFPVDVAERLLAVGGDVVQPHCRGSSCTTFDLNAWTDSERFHLDDYVGRGLVELHAVGGTMLLVGADRHRDGLTWPAYLHGAPYDRVRTDAASIGRDEIGEVETEGSGMLAYDMGITCWGSPS
jgi:peptide chain release factor subunit 1